MINKTSTIIISISDYESSDYDANVSTYDEFDNLDKYEKIAILTAAINSLQTQVDFLTFQTDV